MSPAWFGCADRARLREDPLIGTAPYAHGWFLIEHPGPWGVDALVQADLGHQVIRSLSATAHRAGWRVLLIRRPGRRTDPPERSWIAIGSSRVVRGHWQAGTDLLDAAALVPLLAAPARPAELVAQPAEPTEPVILVCTHGTHDTCCAVRGRPVAGALAARWPEAVWECSHLGGDRFAANVVVLPDAAYYGNLDAGSAVAVVESHLAGRLAIESLRGLARFPPVAQVALAEAHRRLGPLAAASITAGRVEQLEPHRWRVPVAAPGGNWLAIVIAERRESALLTCRASSATRATAYDVVEFARS